MRKVEIFPGICGLITNVEAEMIDEDDVRVKVVSMCSNIRGMMEELGDEFEAFELCLQKPGEGPFFDYAKEHFPVHVSCPAICGIIKAVEAEAKLALPKSAYINFVD
ncbi:MAG: hypothetical protein K6G78_06075 [bacterium]|nr:hypothetical protein [bacterium]